MMDESDNNTRRRRGAGTQHNNHNSTSIEIPNGSGCYYDRDQQQQLDDDENRNRSTTANNKKKKKKKLKARHTTTTRKKKKRRAVGGGSSDCDGDNYYDDYDYVDDDLPFGILVMRVGFVVILIFITFFSLYRYISPAASPPPSIGDFYDDDDDDYNNGNYQQEQQQEAGDGSDDVVLKKNLGVQQELHPIEGMEEDRELPPPPPLPVWNLSAKSKYDAYGIAEQLNVDNNNNNNNNNQAEDQSKSTKRKRDSFWQAANGLRERFAENYGGVNAARAILERGLTTFVNDTDNDIRVTACRLIRTRDVEKRPFNFAFGGYSVTAGRGNYFSQSYPFVMEKLLHTAFHLLDMELSVINAAIGGSPAFPYGWCMNNFWGSEPLDVVNWDYSMNEAGDGVKNPAAGFEAYIRHVLQLSVLPPKLIVKDTHMAIERRNVLQQYVQHKQLHDPVVIHTDPAAAPFLEIQEELHRPNGFQQWRQFGGPPGSPGQVSHHPAVKEHEFIAWHLTMHFLSALQLVAAHDDDVNSAGGSSGSNSLQCNSSDGTNNNNKEETHLTTTPAIVPVPEVINNKNDRNTTKQQQKPWSSLLYGEPITNSSTDDKNSGGRTWIMNLIHCRTSYEPLRQGSLSDVIWSGSVGEDIDVMKPKSGYYYNRGWVLDMSDAEKKAKHKSDGFGGGFLDSKKAYYGLYSSGPLRLFLPYEPSSNSHQDSLQLPQQPQPNVGDRANEWFKSVVLCEVNEKRTVAADDADFGVPCNAGKDTSYTVGGVNITNSSKAMIDTVGSLFMGKKLCMYLPVPDSARLTTRGSLLQKETRKQHLLLLAATEDEKEVEKNQAVGLAVDVRVHNRHIMRQQQACSISHAIWEQQQQQQHPQKS